jgi:hypothetical protein
MVFTLLSFVGSCWIRNPPPRSSDNAVGATTLPEATKGMRTQRVVTHLPILGLPPFLMSFE